ncbi:MAG: transporter substrate-binding domain-containing protein [Dysgonamonadaceae bacterium]|jgi:membrane-bound lytic murein transglycosylase MltF|nr:transporter substrate-binding domain-containing protein [Dysgonamonadaceae bacterium]
MNHKKKNFIVLGGIAILLGAIFLCLYFSGKSGTAVRDWEEIYSEGEIRIVTEYNSVGYYVSGDTVAGAQYDLCRYLEQRSGLKVNIALENNFETAIDKLNRNIYDIIALNIPITTQSRTELAFTIPITQNKQVLVQRKPEPGDTIPVIRNQMDLAHKTVYVPQNSPVILRLKNLAEEIAEPIVIEEVAGYTQEELAYMAAYGTIDYAVVDKEIALKISRLFPNIDIETDISFTQLQAWAVRKSSPVLLDSLNVWLKK